MRLTRLVLVVLLAGLFTSLAVAGTSDTVAFQGRMKTSGGVAIPDGVYSRILYAV